MIINFAKKKNKQKFLDVNKKNEQYFFKNKSGRIKKMKKVRGYTVSVLMVSLCLLIACSNPSSPETSMETENTSSNLQRNFEYETFESEFTLEPGDTINLNYDNTHLILIKSYSISNCQINKKDLHIRTSNQVGNNSLPCHWKEHGSFAFEDLSVINISRQTKNIKVYLSGYTLIQ